MVIERNEPVSVRSDRASHQPGMCSSELLRAAVVRPQRVAG